MTFNRLSFVQSVWKNFINANGFDAHVIGKMKIVNVLDDIGGSLSIAAKGLYSTGLSTDLNVSFINIAKKNDIVIMTINEYEKENKRLQDELTKITNMTAKDLWLKDLDLEEEH
ncbi:876_t:CDS:2 [Entrophospora sp. SA101]|nr:876_t:CDS:2 [Entrophospora sp. SA101]